MTGAPAEIPRRDRRLTIVVDLSEARSGLAEILSDLWAYVLIRRLPVGDVAIGERVRIERKTTGDLLSSLRDGRLFGQCGRLAREFERPVLLVEGDLAELAGRVDPGALRGAFLAITVGLRVPMLFTRDVEDTASTVRHLAAQEARRLSREARRPPSFGPPPPAAREPFVPPETARLLEALPGVGPRMARRIATRIGGIEALVHGSVRDLLAVPGVGPDRAAGILDALRGVRVSSSRPG